MQSDSTPTLLGLCQCGCGEHTPLARKTSRRAGYVRGQPRRFVNSAHAARSQPHGAHAYRWKGGRIISSRGYVFLWTEDRGYVQEHRLVMEAHLGRRLKRSEVVHHRNHDKLDNRLENLEVMRQGEHARQHIQIQTWTRAYAACRECGTTERPHQGRGLCQRCYRRQGKSPDTFDTALTGRWARAYDACTQCGTTERPHICHGLCSLCYERNRHRVWTK